MTPARIKEMARSQGRGFGLLFDLDDTLVDTSETFDACVLQLSGATREELLSLRSQGGFNDDWQAVQEFLRRSGVARSLPEIEEQGQKLYLEMAPGKERLLVSLERIQSLRPRHPLLVFTGRVRAEYAPIWGQRLDPLFDEILCKNDPDVHHSKPHPQGLQLLLQRHQLKFGAYVGNSVDDMAAARAAGLLALGVTTNQSSQTLIQAGAQLVASSVDEILGWLD